MSVKITQYKFPVAIALVLSFFIPDKVSAAPWRLGANVLVAEEYTDGKRAGVEQEGQFITQLSPGVSVNRQGRRIGVQGQYSYNHRISSGNTVRNNSNHSMRSAANVELVRNHLFLNSSSSYQRSITDPLGFLPISSSTAENQNDILTNTFGARLTNRFDRFAQSNANYSYSTTKQIGDSRASGQQKLEAGLTSGPSFARLSWGLKYNYRQTFGEGGHSKREAHSLLSNIGYQFTKSLSATYTAGYEINPKHSEKIIGSEVLQGSVKTLTINWAPSRKWSFTGVYGERSFGKTYNLSANWIPTSRTSIMASYGLGPTGENYQGSLSHRKRKSTWSVNYTESYSSRPHLEAEQRIGILTDENGDIILDPDTGNAFSIPVTVPVLIDDLFIRKLLSANVSFKGRKTTLSFNGSYERRFFEKLALVDKFYRVGSNMSRAVGKRASVSVSVGANRNTSAQSSQRDTFGTLTTAYNHRLGKRANVALQYRFLKRYSTNNSREQEDYLIRAQFSMSFGR